MVLFLQICRLPWKVTGVMLADTLEAYKEKEKTLIAEFKRVYKLDFPAQESYYATEGILNWVERSQPRKYIHIFAVMIFLFLYFEFGFDMKKEKTINHLILTICL